MSHNWHHPCFLGENDDTPWNVRYRFPIVTYRYPIFISTLKFCFDSSLWWLTRMTSGLRPWRPLRCLMIWWCLYCIDLYGRYIINSFTTYHIIFSVISYLDQQLARLVWAAQASKIGSTLETIDCESDYNNYQPINDMLLVYCVWYWTTNQT